ncbi:hypothetical protein TEA_021585 [Camellia sinensis var. sinensis]|uniref:Leucine-rich repeat-containing N-terminal plant-type domain-containing protein n=1 Tax=Camellia sinensis var. sinensis TaxID=542762 RepID=A0A4S4D2G7_CAMSN|nr:hypothetical protein TEA_021585 [Camellia sinensis var. sinensis]
METSKRRELVFRDFHYLLPVPNSLNTHHGNQIRDIATLEELVLEDNQLGGPLHQNLGNLSCMRRLFLSANNFTGTIPDTFSKLKNLTDFRIDGSVLSGKIPDLIGNWTKIKTLLNHYYNNLEEQLIASEMGST